MSDDKWSSSPCLIGEFDSAYTGLLKPAELQALLQQLLNWEQGVLVCCHRVRDELPPGERRDLLDNVCRSATDICEDLKGLLRCSGEELATAILPVDLHVPHDLTSRLEQLRDALAMISDCLSENIPKVPEADLVSWLNRLAAQTQNQSAALESW